MKRYDADVQLRRLIARRVILDTPPSTPADQLRRFDAWLEEVLSGGYDSTGEDREWAAELTQDLIENLLRNVFQGGFA